MPAQVVSTIELINLASVESDQTCSVKTGRDDGPHVRLLNAAWGKTFVVVILIHSSQRTWRLNDPVQGKSRAWSPDDDSAQRNHGAIDRRNLTTTRSLQRCMFYVDIRLTLMHEEPALR